MLEIRTKTRIAHSSPYRIRKLIFWVVMILLVLLTVLAGMRRLSYKRDTATIRVGICGAVNKEAVYSLREGSDLSLLVQLAKGFTTNADMRNINLELLLKNDSIYHIPAWIGNDTVLEKRRNSLADFQSSSSLTKSLSPSDIKYQDNDKMYSILYIGQPSVFILINYFPKQQLINFVHLPLSTVFLTNDYRLVDLFYTLDINPTLQIISNKLNQTVQFYMIQNRFDFIALIDQLGGVKIHPDETFVREYKLKKGTQRLGGFHTWEYVRFIDWKNIPASVKNDRSIDRISNDNFTIAAHHQELLFEMRNQRQRSVVRAMRQAFDDLSGDGRLKLIEKFPTLFRTNIDSKLLTVLYNDILTTKRFSVGSLPGYYERDSTKLYFYPDVPGYKSLYQQQIRRDLEKRGTQQQTIY